MVKKEFTATQVMALQERLEKKIDLIAEQHGSIVTDIRAIKQRLDAIEEQVAQNTVSIAVIIKDIEEIKTEIKEIKSIVGFKISKEEFTKVESRVSILEQKLGFK